MDDVKWIFASNLIRLRTAAGMTQLELGEALNYTDKAVSKWERAESVPDIAAMIQIARLFHVTLDELVSPQETWKLPVTEEEERRDKRRVSWFIILLSLLGIASAAGLVFIILWMVGRPFPQIFVFMLPILMTTWLTLNSCLLEGKGNRYLVMGLVTSLLVVVYVALSWVKDNPWQLFILTVPLNLIVWLSFVVSKSLRRRKSTESREEDNAGRED